MISTAADRAKADQKKRDEALKTLIDFWRKYKKEYTEVRQQEIEAGKKCYAVEKKIKAFAKEADIQVDSISPEGELLVVIDRHVRII